MTSTPTNSTPMTSTPTTSARTLRRGAGGSLLVMALTVLLVDAGLLSSPARAQPAGAAPAEPTAVVRAAVVPSARAMDVLGALEVKGRAPMTGYSRTAFGPAWADIDQNGCDTRNDMLRRDLTGETFRPGTRNCIVVTGSLADPYTAQQLTFRKAQGSAIQIDHVVALGDAWQKGAQQWSPAQRLAFANDPLNLLAVDGPTNQRKGASDAATWLPPNKAHRCRFVARQAAVKSRYGAWVTPAEKSAIDAVLRSCPTQRVPRMTAPLPVAGPLPFEPLPDQPLLAQPLLPQPLPSQPLPVQPVAAIPGAALYANCAAARAAGAAPLRRGQPGYRPALDGDSDGVACQ